MIKSNTVGYSFWGFLADVKMDEDLNELSTPDGNAFYSWSIIRELQKQGKNVLSIMPDRDKYAVRHLGENAFSAWATKERYRAYSDMSHIEYRNWEPLTERYLYKIWDKQKLYMIDFIIHEWRMKIPGRNDLESKGKEDWQPDYFIQNCLIKYCISKGIKLFIFDLDYKLSEEIVDLLGDNITILELGNKWNKKYFSSKSEKVYIPFSFENINDFGIVPVSERSNNLVYVGNRYERDWCIDKYVPDGLKKCVVYGNWKESGRDSESRWPNIEFRGRLQTKDMYNVYSDSICTLLLAKEEYCKYSFMTARIIESIFYGTVPLFISEYGSDTIREYAGKFADILTVQNEFDVVDRIEFFKHNEEIHKEVIEYLRIHLSMMDAKFFVQKIESMLY